MTAIVKLTDRFTETRLDNEVVIMRIDTGEFFALAGTAVAIGRLPDRNLTRAELKPTLAGEHAADEAQLTRDVDEFLVALKEAGLIAGA